jgi:hypothetical protein
MFGLNCRFKHKGGLVVSDAKSGQEISDYELAG